ncbi:MAG: hypothetical protein K0R75_3672 [Paenibacillaceae bacterium]|jgi:dipeptidyl aminopeptidase/acylaminoacyl peptidase|nr:hypothetical protein [Paenibacillaceae bacterium]
MEMTPSSITLGGQIESAPKTYRARLKKTLLVLTLSLSFLAVSGILVFHAYIAWILARPHIDPLNSNPKRAIGATYEDITFPALNGKTTLNGWYIPAPNAKSDASKTVIFSHGYGGNREEFWIPIYDLARSLIRQNYNVLMFDYSYAQPGKAVVTGGVQESQELLGAVNYIKQKAAGQIFIWGFSMGAGTALQAAIVDDADISGMILDSTFLLNPDTLYHNMKQYIDLPRFPSLWLVRLFFPVLNGASLNQIPYQQIMEMQYPMPILFVHGEEDERAPYEVTEEIFDHQQGQLKSQLWLLPNGEHELLYKYHRRQYLQKTMDFLSGL